MSNKGFWKKLAQTVTGNSASGSINTQGLSSQAKNAADAAIAEERRKQANKRKH